jgi:hypothetical protein
MWLDHLVLLALTIAPIAGPELKGSDPFDYPFDYIPFIYASSFFFHSTKLMLFLSIFSGWTIRHFNGGNGMKMNVGMIDKVLRIIAGVVLIGLTLMGTIGVWGWIGVIPLVTGAMGWCPLYSIIGVNTCATKE